MADAQERYAIYFVPEASSDLWQIGCRWLGREPDAGQDSGPVFPDEATAANLSPDAWASLTEAPRRYGFHATLKPPFALRPDCDLADLDSALAHFAAARRSVEGPRFLVASLGNFIALRPAGTDTVLSDLAADCVRAFDSFRHSPSAAELARRRASKLTARQEDLLETWGYPYVFEEFRFHMTLTGPLENAAKEALFPYLEKMFHAALTTPVRVAGVALFREPAPGAPFETVRRYRFPGE